MSNRQKKERKPYLHKTKNGSKKNGTLNKVPKNQELKQIKEKAKSRRKFTK